MIKGANLLNKFFSAVLSLLIVFQSILPGLQSIAYAQEATGSGFVEEPQLSETPSVSPSESEEATKEASLIPNPTDEPSPTPTPEDQNNEQSQDITEGQPNAPPSDEINPTSTPEASPYFKDINFGHISAIILENTDAESLQLDLSTQDSASAVLATDKADYAPTDTAVITGSAFPKEVDLKLIITADNYRFEDSAKTDENGSFTYFYQLDGTYRPLYNVEAQDENGQVLATTSFTDSPISGCSTDSAGANDEPGQKDLNKMCVDYTGLPTTINIDWNWDDIKWTGSNTGDVCSLFDTDGDGLTNYSLCVRVAGDPATYQNHFLFSCSDGDANRCTNSAIITNTSTCDASVQADDPFPGPPNSEKGNAYPDDTAGSCTINISDFSSASAQLIDVCSYPSQQPNSDPSDCIVFKQNTGKLEVVKVLSPSSDTGKFNLQIDGVTEATDVGDGGTTLEKVLIEGDHTVGEVTGTGTDLSSYTSSIVCKDLNGTGSIVAQAGNSGPLTVSLQDEQDVVCTITNTVNNGTIVVHKDVRSPNGEDITDISENFTVKLDGADGQTITDGGTVTYNNVTPGSHTITEDTPPSGYDLYSITPDSDGSTAGAQISIPAGGTVDVYVINRQQASTLTLVKTVIIDNGGTAVANDFQAYINGNVVDWNVAQILTAGNYTASEDTLSGYTASDWGGDCAADGTVSLALGETKVCTITNDDQPAEITLIKLVSNSFGGDALSDDFNLTINDDVVLSGSTTVVSTNEAHTINETDIQGYTFISITGDDKCPAVLGGTVTLDEGEHITCTITNADIAPELTVIKHVVNDNGGILTASNFTMLVLGTNVSQPIFPGSENGTTVTLDAGAYEAGEIQLSGYGVLFEGDCEGTIAVGEHKTCTVINDDIPAKLTVTKIVEGGNAQVSDFNLFVNATQVTSSVQNEFNAGDYSVTENGPAGYTTTFGGDCDENGNVRVEIGNEKTCTVTNTRDTGTITVIKDVIPDDESLWDILISGTASESATLSDGQSTEALTLPTGKYTVTESAAEGVEDGYASSFSCSSGEEQIAQGSGRSISLDLQKEQAIVCTFTNEFVPPVLTLAKTNNRLGIDVSPGADVIYTLIVSLTGAPLKNVLLTDLLPNGFVYRGESWSTNSSVRGDLRAAGTTPDPSYASPGIWILGDMIPGEIVTLTLIADIKSDIDLGLYKDLAWTKGQGLDSQEILGNEDTGIFVGTEVNVVAGLPGTNFEVERTEEREGEVLGISTALPSTGADTRWVILATILFALGSASVVSGVILRRKYD